MVMLYQTYLDDFWYVIFDILVLINVKDVDFWRIFWIGFTSCAFQVTSGDFVESLLQRRGGVIGVY